MRNIVDPNDTRRLAWIVGGVTIGLILVSILVYIYNFYGHQVSDDPTNWGSAGDFFGGILNPLLAIVNILVLVYLTLLVAQYERTANLNQFRHTAYRELSRILDEIEEQAPKWNPGAIKPKKKQIESFEVRHRFLFTNNQKKVLQQLVGGIILHLDYFWLALHLYKDISTNKEREQALKSKHYQTFSEFKEWGANEKLHLKHFLQLFNIQKEALLSFFQRTMVGEKVDLYKDFDAREELKKRKDRAT